MADTIAVQLYRYRENEEPVTRRTLVSLAPEMTLARLFSNTYSELHEHGWPSDIDWYGFSVGTEDDSRYGMDGPYIGAREDGTWYWDWNIHEKTLSDLVRTAGFGLHKSPNEGVTLFCGPYRIGNGYLDVNRWLLILNTLYVVVQVLDTYGGASAGVKELASQLRRALSSLEERHTALQSRGAVEPEYVEKAVDGMPEVRLDAIAGGLGVSVDEARSYLLLLGYSAKSPNVYVKSHKPDEVFCRECFDLLSQDIHYDDEQSFVDAVTDAARERARRFVQERGGSKQISREPSDDQDGMGVNPVD